jgi:hypothetical protein
MGSMGIAEWILILLSLGIVAGLSVIILKIAKKKVSFWKILGVSFLVLFVFNLITRLIKG